MEIWEQSSVLDWVVREGLSDDIISETPERSGGTSPRIIWGSEF